MARVARSSSLPPVFPRAEMPFSCKTVVENRVASDFARAKDECLEVHALGERAHGRSGLVFSSCSPQT